MSTWGKALVAVTLMIMGTSAFANQQEFGFLKNKTKMEIFKAVQNSCTVKIGDQTLAFKDVQSEAGDGWSVLVFSTDANDRADHVYAQLTVNFDDASRLNGANLTRYAEMSQLALQAFNNAIWFASGDRSRVDASQLLGAALKDKSVGLSSTAWADSDHAVKAVVQCTPKSWLL